MDAAAATQAVTPNYAHAGSRQMPPWSVAELPDAPRFTWRNWVGLIGPGLLMGGASIGGGEWLLGPGVTARYGPALLWLATLSIVGQVFYNLEVSRYTLATGEPIFTGKFRTMPGPGFWVVVYLLLDVGSIFPYLASNAAVPLLTAVLGRIPSPSEEFSLLGMTVGYKAAVRSLGVVLFLLCLVPLVFGGKIYNSLKVVLSTKVIIVLGFLLFLALTQSSLETWRRIFVGFFQFGTVPTGGSETQNVFAALFHGDPLKSIDFTNVAMLAAFASIAGSGGLTNAVISNYTRDQGWGMGRHVGAIPSMVGGREIALSHVGCVFDVNGEQSLPRWRRWYRHIVRDQVCVWMLACFLGVALPSMLSVQFLPRGTTASDWVVPVMTADGVRAQVSHTWGAGWGRGLWYAIVLCGLIVLLPAVAQTADGIIRRWVDALWTASPGLRQLDEHKIRQIYFRVLVGYMVFGVATLALTSPGALVKIATNIYNFALGISCFHTLYVNLTLLPRPLRPGWFVRGGLVLAGLFFIALATVSAIQTARMLLG